MSPAQPHAQCCEPPLCILTSLFFSYLHLPSLVLTYLTRASLEVRASKGLRLVLPEIAWAAQSPRHKKEGAGGQTNAFFDPPAVGAAGYTPKSTSPGAKGLDCPFASVASPRGV
jgi:hypothetical protein